MLLLDQLLGELDIGINTFAVCEVRPGSCLVLEDDEMALRAIQDGAQDYYPKELTKTTGISRYFSSALMRETSSSPSMRGI